MKKGGGGSKTQMHTWQEGETWMPARVDTYVSTVEFRQTAEDNIRTVHRPRGLQEDAEWRMETLGNPLALTPEEKVAFDCESIGDAIKLTG